MSLLLWNFIDSCDKLFIFVWYKVVVSLSFCMDGSSLSLRAEDVVLTWHFLSEFILCSINYLIACSSLFIRLPLAVTWLLSSRSEHNIHLFLPLTHQKSFATNKLDLPGRSQTTVQIRSICHLGQIFKKFEPLIIDRARNPGSNLIFWPLCDVWLTNWSKLYSILEINGAGEHWTLYSLWP